MKNPTYIFAKEPEEIAEYVSDIWKGNNAYHYNSRQRELFYRAYSAYYGLTFSTMHSTEKIGEQGEFTGISINELRSNIKSVISMTTQNRVVFDCVTTSTDVQAQNNVIIGNALLEQKFYVDKIESKTKQMLEQGLVFGTCYFYLGWKTSDEMVGVDGEGKPVYKGMIDAKPLNALDVMVEPSVEQWDEHEYIMFRRMENRYNLAAKYPEVAEEILALPIPQNLLTVKPGATAEEQANIWVYYTYHKPTKAMPQGLMHVCLDKAIVLFSDVNPYECLPVVCYRPNIIYGSSHGHALAYDLMPAQSALTTLDSSFLTLAENFAIPNITASKQFGATETALSGGMKLVTGQADKDAPNGGFPMAMNMPKPDTVYLQLAESYQTRLMTLAGQNAASRGQTQSQQSGTAIALAQSAAQTYNSSVEGAYIIALEQIASLLLRVCKLFMTRQEILEQAGLSLEFQATTFANASLDQISQVKIDVGNALAKTISGRLEIATQLLNQGQISAQDYLSILQTGNLPKVIQSKTSVSQLIQDENQFLITGQKPIVSILDNHILHIQEHMVVINNPNLRATSNILALTLEHIEEHLAQLEQLKMGNPDLCDIVLAQPIGTTRQAMMGMPQQAPQPEQVTANSEPESSPIEGNQTAESAIEQGPEAVAQSGRQRAEKELASAGGE